ncbi:alanyl-tRNA synthase [Dinoroseobacter shibae DFL 12 = DSM 16493]|jgi:alanyl-tRNA synthetase|uniref:Alanine--tRNA ligase n=1 Tax=Dinoroseobacter shibae (strain DSM 16493 / NCIMB 14021 / DFL 12) TaxID=398580 RepID=SYA_DINSH|nr:alanine--tRNA ligase [Dinoroseobacter shibae]A8LL20.1 RecName: Full=Alanine--tRNA ligase; AltName: Full=Alanyl-tRNA synthetase; Short=AlaRS [Dinoroseobacter shibae DFL 12 = DSM 16493]ABV93384.1 alanyl-tRNA synthase [Dinoroseobacter shibae DFL 12 = DSM 16493]URF48299.1 alanine--tRNA ligase [Dinoroseobacter shibae]URF52609.1 alanine--tRNA ligase [Dinoroseobacter shibae]
MPSLNEIRSTFLNFFGGHGHEIVDSSPLVPRNDPTLMFTNAGMVQFKNVFTGLEHRDYNRATTSQKCVRAGGKHNDLDNVGYTARHHTFFEMLGNFSFGDYFKEDAIPFAWDLITKEFGIDKSRLLVTVYHTDDEAAEIWKKHAGLSDDRIIRIPTNDNFWMMGPTGPCGPCTEIFYDHGDHIWGGPPGSPEEDGDRFIEIWNLVFMQFEQFEDGTREPLPKPSIDTGMGLERIGALLQGSHDNYDTDLFKTLIEASAHATSVDPYGDKNVHHRVIADHLRSTSFLIADGVMPSNEGRGYVLRRIMRRAMRHAHLLGAQDPVMYRLVPALVGQMGQAFPELGRAQALIEETLMLEETRFRQTLDRGLKLLDEAVADVPEGGALPGETAFKLYDTYGFPLDLTQDALREKGRAVETEGFDAAMADQKAKARAAWAGSGETADESIWFDLAETHGATEFLGYDTEVAEGQVLALVKDGAQVAQLAEGETGWMVLNQTPFYAESGGQVGDSGGYLKSNGSGAIHDTQKRNGLFAHKVTPKAQPLKAGDVLEMRVDPARRTAIRANHSATHLLHEALRQALGAHVAQRGSLNAADRLRFDFSHSKALTLEELQKVEAEVNAYIRQNSPVETRIMTPDAARDLGAQALFGEKYGDEVRVVSMGRQSGSGKGVSGETYSLELCGGTHVKQTGDIGVFVTVGETASSSGVRRIEALTGEDAFAYLSAQDYRLAEVAASLKAQAADVPERVRSLLDERKALQNEVAQLRRELAMAGGGQGTAAPEAEAVAGVPFLAQSLSGVSGRDLPSLIDEHKARLGSGAILLIADTGGKAAVAAGVTADLTDRLSAVDLVKAAVAELGGKGGGGRPDMAQGGGKDASKADAAIAAAKAVIGG